MNERRTLLRMAGWAVAITLGLGGAACDLDEDEPAPRDQQGGRYMMSIGNSLTAGFQSSGINRLGQEASFVNHVSRALVGRPMQSPLVDTPGIGSTPGFTPLFIDETGNLTAEPLTVETTDLLLNARFPIPYDNMGVPGATTEEMLNQRDGSGGNPFFDLILRNIPNGLPGGGTVIEQVERRVPDIITLWTGNNEVLGGATSGSPQNTDPDADGYVYPIDVFEDFFMEMCDRIDEMNPEIVAVANVPPVSAIPFTKFWGPSSPFGTRWNMEEDCDDDPPCDVRHVTDTDDDPVELVLLPAGSGIAACVGCYIFNCADEDCLTIPANFTLEASEVELIDTAIAGYNVIIAREAAARGWAHVDINAAFLDLPTSTGAAPLNTFFPWNLLAPTPSQNMTSAFTLDGVHPSEKGHVEIANAFLTAINEQYGTSHPLVDITTVDNIAGFERAPVPGRFAHTYDAIMDENAGEVLSGLNRMFNPRF